MTWLFADSFDFYATPADAGYGHWDTLTNNGLTLTAGRFSGSRAITAGSNNNGTFSKNSGVNSTGHHFVLAVNPSTTNNGNYSITLYDGSTAQCTVNIGPTSITLVSGTSGTTLATYNGAPTAGIWTGVELEVIIGSTTGSFSGRFNGQTTNLFSFTGLNTQVSTNAYASAIALGLGVGGFGSQPLSFDDFLWFSTSGSAPNTWVGDICAVQQMPNGDASDQWSNPNPGGASNYNSTSTADTSQNYSNGYMNLVSVVPSTSGTVQSLSVSCVSASASGTFQMAVYDSSGSGGGPGNLLCHSSSLSALTTGINTFPVTSGPTLAAGSTYWIAFLGTASSYVYGNNVSETNYYRFLGAGTTTFPNPAAATSQNSKTSTYQGVSLSGSSNAGQVNQTQEDGDTTYVFSSTAGQVDQYTLAAPAFTPNAVIGVQTRMFARKTQTNAHVAQIELKSGSTTVNGGSYTLGTNYTYTRFVNTVDPNTSAAWTGSAINSMTIGPYLVS